jgi:hypothetical protein
VGHLLGGGMNWSDADARQFQQASQQYHDAVHGHRDTLRDGDLEAARTYYLEQQEALLRAQQRGDRSRIACRWLGGLLIVAGVSIYFVKQFVERA